MVLPTAAPERLLKHSRRLDVQMYSRADSLWEVDAVITDVKTRDVELGGNIRPAGDPIHDMLLRLVIDTQFNVLEAGSERCHALRTDGDVVRLHYPRWHRARAKIPTAVNRSQKTE
jgi:hypothetical protein